MNRGRYSGAVRRDGCSRERLATLRPSRPRFDVERETRTLMAVGLGHMFGRRVTARANSPRLLTIQVMELIRKARRPPIITDERIDEHLKTIKNIRKGYPDFFEP